MAQNLVVGFLLTFAAISLVLGIYVTAVFQSTLNITTLSTTAQNQITSTFNTVYLAFGLASIALIVLAAVVVLGPMMGFGSGRGR